jgi:hypothetical protein
VEACIHAELDVFCQYRNLERGTYDSWKIRRLNPQKESYNGTGFLVKEMNKDSSNIDILSGAFLGNKVIVPRIEVFQSETIQMLLY